MADRSTWGRIRGGLANLVAGGGKVYNPYTGQYAPASVRTARFVSGGLNAVGGPLASLGGQIYSRINNRTDAAQAWDAGLRGWEGINKQLSQRPDTNQLGLDVPDVDVGPVGGNYNARLPTLAPVVSTAPSTAQTGPWTGLGTSTGNAFQGGQLGNWIHGPSGGQGSPRAYGQAAGSFTPYGAGIVQVAGQGWGGQSAAQGFGLGSGGSGASAGADAIADAQRANRKNRV